tara:strand:+ start:1025 stop:2419 length:1395 start_codon:yes stop_codon:yes gene_type:complete
MTKFKLLLTSDFFVRWLPLAAFCAVIAHHLWFVNSYAINVPHQDDIYDFVQFVSVVENTDSAGDGFKALFNQYNDHRTSASRLLVFGVYLTEGELNFHTLTLVADLGLLLILLVFYLTVRKEKYRWVYLLVAALMLLNFRYFNIILFSQAAFAYYYVCLYAFACIFTLHKVSGPRFLLAAVFCTLSSLTLSSGHIVWLIGLVSLLHQYLVSGHRSLMWPAMWLLVATVILTLWYGDFTQGVYMITSELIANNVDSSPVTAGEVPFRAMVDPSIAQILEQYATVFLVILGSAPIYFSTVGAGAAGLVILLVLLFVSLKSYKHDDIRLALYCWFLVAFAAAVTVGRALLGTPEYVLNQRYSFISALLVCTLVLLLQVRFSLVRTPAVLLVLLLAVTYWSWSNFRFEPQVQNHMNQRHSTFNNGHFPVVLMPVGESDVIVNKAISDGIYNPPCRPFPECERLSSVGD